MNSLNSDPVYLTLVVACYNESQNIVGTLDALREALSQFSFTYEIVIMDDASTDNSIQVIRGYMVSNPEFPVQLIIREKNMGLARNYIDGAFIGRGEWYRLICGDNVEPVDTFVKIFRRIGEAEMVIPYQVECKGRSFSRALISRTYTALVNLISGYKIKYYNGLTVHRRFNVQRWHTNHRGFGFQADMITRLLDEGMSFIEVPVIAHDRNFGKSTALTKKNLLSIGHTFFNLSIRRISKAFF